MTRNGLQFTKPAPGDERAYHLLFTMMMDLYALYGEPLTQIPETEVAERPQPPEEKKDIADLEDVKELMEQP